MGNTHQTWVGLLDDRPSSVLADGWVVAIPLAFPTVFEPLGPDCERATFNRRPWIASTPFDSEIRERRFLDTFRPWATIARRATGVQGPWGTFGLHLTPESEVGGRGKGRKDRALTLWKEVGHSLRAWLAVRADLIPQADTLALQRTGHLCFALTFDRPISFDLSTARQPTRGFPPSTGDGVIVRRKPPAP